MSDVERIFENVRGNLPLDEIIDLQKLLAKEVSTRKEELQNMIWSKVLEMLEAYQKEAGHFYIRDITDSDDVVLYSVILKNSSKTGILELDFHQIDEEYK